MRGKYLALSFFLPLWLLQLFFSSTLSPAQATRPQSNEAPGPNAEKAVGPDDPVITLKGFCPENPQHADSCQTVITRAQFEKLTEALDPGMPPPMRLKVAYNYARILRMAVEAEKRGLDKTPAFSEEMRYARMQLLSQDLDHALREAAEEISPADIEEFYKKNESSFEQAMLARIFVPHSKQVGSSHSHEAAMLKLANEIRGRAANGEDPDKLQIEAYSAAGITGSAPKTAMERVRRMSLPPTHEIVMNLKPGEVSEVVSDPEGAHFIYKMISKQTLPLEEVKAEIREQIASQRYKDSMKPFQGGTAFSDAYFATHETHAVDSHRRRAGEGAETPVHPAENHN